MDYNKWTEKQLLSLKHNDHEEVFNDYIKKTPHVRDKQDFLLSWIAPNKNDFILECGSSSGKTCVDLAKRGGCHMLGIDFDPTAIEVSTRMMTKHFPELKGTCYFKKGNLTTMKFESNITKIIMPDFTEHIPDSVFGAILVNIKKQLPHVLLYIYTPIRTHIFEIMKHNNFLLKNPEGHINVKTERELKEFLESHSFRIIEMRWRPSHIPLFKYVEFLFGHLPIIGKLFHRRLAIMVNKKNE